MSPASRRLTAGCTTCTRYMHASRPASSARSRRSLAYLKGLLSHTERKNGWQLAEAAGEQAPDGMQRLLNASRWDVDAAHHELVASARARLAHPVAFLGPPR